MTEPNTFQTWVPILAPVATVLAAGIAAIPLFRQLRLKRQEEARLAEASRAEIDARLMTLFVQLMGKAHARGDSTIADSAVQAIISSHGELAPTTLESLTALVESAVVTYPVGAAEQEAAIAAVAELAARYEILHQPALAGLQKLETWLKSSRALPSALAKSRGSTS